MTCNYRISASGQQIQAYDTYAGLPPYDSRYHGTVSGIPKLPSHPGLSGSSSTSTTTTPAPIFTNLATTTSSMEQQTFLGASISNWSCNGGLNNSSSELNVTLVVDDDNGDSFYGDDYVGKPVWFTFGNTQEAGVDAGAGTYKSAFNNVIDAVYGYNPQSDRTEHFCFGGLLQSWNYNEDAQNGKTYTVKVVDPKEVVQNVVLILNNYAGITGSVDNIINIYGYLEDTSDRSHYTYNNLRGSFTVGNKMFPGDPDNTANTPENAYVQGTLVRGDGLSLRSEYGIPAFRVYQALGVMMGTHAAYNLNSSFGGPVTFRGFRYAIDISQIYPPYPEYVISNDTISLYDLFQEFCEVQGRDLVVTLVPLRNRTGISSKYSRWNGANVDAVIVLHSIKRKDTTVASAQQYINNMGEWITNKDIGSELVPEVTDRFVSGGNTVDMYYFSAEYDEWPSHGGHALGYSLDNQIVPFYGSLGGNRVILPRGKGAWSQIMLDASSLDAEGVKDNYVATEIELRAAEVSFDCWVGFLQSYNAIYKERVDSDGDILDAAYKNVDVNSDGFITSGSWEVTVPRCVHVPTTKDYEEFANGQKVTCSPPYGFPLYWGRASAIGLYSGGDAGMSYWSARVSEQGEGEEASGGVRGNDLNEGYDNAVKSRSDAKMGLENAKKVYSFLKKIADDCLGRKFLVKMPQFSNKHWNASEPWGFPNRDSYGSPVYGNGSWTKAIKEDMLKYGGVSRSKTDSAGASVKHGLNYLYQYQGSNKTQYTYSYYPEPQGGAEASGVTNTPAGLLDYFTDDGRISPFVKLASPQESFTNSKNFSVDIDSLNAGDYLIEKSSSGIYLRAELDPNYYFASDATTKSVGCWPGGTSEESFYPENQDEVSATDGTEVAIRMSRARILEPTITSGTSVSYSYQYDEYPDELYHIYCLITIPRVSYRFSESQYAWSNAGGVEEAIQQHRVDHYQRKDITRGMVGFGTTSDFPNTYGYSTMFGKDTVEKKSVDGLDWSINRRIITFTPQPVWPKFVALPLMSTEHCYGPWVSRNGDSVGTNGLVEYRNEQSLAPWNYGGSFSIMNGAGLLAASDDNLVPIDLETERASFTMVGIPSGIVIGTQLSYKDQGAWYKGTAVTNVSLNVGQQGMLSTISLDSYTPKFGTMRRQQENYIKKSARAYQQNKDTINQLTKKGLYRGGKFTTNAKVLQQKSSSNFSNNNYGYSRATSLESGSRSSANTINISVHAGNTSHGDPYGNTTVDYATTFWKKFSSSLQGARDVGEMSSIVQLNQKTHRRAYWNSISTTVHEMFKPASFTWHNILPCVKQRIDFMLYQDSYDSDNQISYYD